MPKTAEEFNFPVYGTQGGGLARIVGGMAFFVTDPKCPGLTVGSDVPREWDLQPANRLAREEAKREYCFWCRSQITPGAERCPSCGTDLF